MSDWRIHRPEERCAGCDRGFLEGESLFSLLLFEGESLQREDRCASCFEARPFEKGAVFWRGRHRRDRRSRLAVDFGAIEELFLALEGRTEERLRELRYLLALLLLRKKRLKLVGVRQSQDGEVLCLRRPRRTEEHEVAVFELDSKRSQALREGLARVFEGADVEAWLAKDRTEDSRPAESDGAEGGGPVMEESAPPA